MLVRLEKVDPDDPRIQNNLAQVSLLLNVDVKHARAVAAQLYRKEGSNPAYTSTYAFALYTKGDAKGALKIMNGLSQSELHDPPIAAYYGVVLVATGKAEKAKEYLKLARAAKLLPEESRLVAKAEKSFR